MSTENSEEGSAVELPSGWARAPLEDLLVGSDAGKSFKCEPRPAAPDEWGIVKVSAMTWGEFRPHENKALLDQALVNPAYEIHAGDILVSRANTVEHVGAPVLVGEVRPRLLLSDKSLRFNPGSAVDRQWFVYWLRSPAIRKAVSEKASGTSDSMRNVSQADLKAIDLPVPPAAEQRRIAEALEDRFTQLDKITNRIESALANVAALRKEILLDAIPGPDQWPSTWEATTTSEAGTIDLGRARHPDWHQGPKMRPYLRVANVFEDRIDTTSLMEMDFSECFDRYRLLPGDILLNEGQSPHLVGRSAMYRGSPEGVAFTNSLLRFRTRDNVLPGWALLVFRRHLHAGRFMREVRITTNIAHLGATRLRDVEFPIPPMAEQQRIVAETKRRLRQADALEQFAERAEAHASALRRALLTEAFAGRLVPQDPDDEHAEDLLKRIRVEREAVETERQEARRATVQTKRKGSTKGGRGAKPSAPADAPPPPSSASDTPLPEGEQITLPLEFTA